MLKELCAMETTQPAASAAPAPLPASAQTFTPSSAKSANPPQLLQTPSVSSIKSEVPVAEPRDPPSSVSLLPPEPSSSAGPSHASSSYVITIPSCSGWFSWDQIHNTERRILPEFFDGKSASKNSEVYKYYRDFIIRRFRANPTRKITLTDVRRGLVGDIGSIRRVFDFLEEWGLINYTPLAKPSAEDKKGNDEGLEKKETPRRICTNCKSSCSMACFTTDKADIILCARCFVRGDYRPGLSSTDFRRLNITEETKTDWTDKETLHLLEAILHYGEDWKKVAEHVGTRSEIDCIARFIKLPFGEQFLGPEGGINGNPHKEKDEVTTKSIEDNAPEQGSPKRMRLTPLADASNPIMAQVSFLSSVVGSNVAQAAAQAAVSALPKVEFAGSFTVNDEKLHSAADGAKEEDSPAVDQQAYSEILSVAAAEAQTKLETEQKDVEQYISDIVQVQMKEIQDKIVHFEELEYLLEKERLQLRHMKDLLFEDQLTYLQHNARPISKGAEGQNTKPSNHVP
ncbi:SWI/SNF complex subunit SWI3B [Curcuma longa]|uniref:SWI/SNF complex subunit SWI3B n=1 Tax=Curcuma longa TaxID=136217 RepID=UPI003D9DB9FF